MALPTRDTGGHTEIWRGLGWVMYEHENKCISLMGTHVDCVEDHPDFDTEWTGQSFYLTDMYTDNGQTRNGYCYGCGVPVPVEVQALMVLFERD